MKLKTLKDLKQFGADPIIEGLDAYEFVEINKLKQEAIKWVKHIEDNVLLEDNFKIFAGKAIAEKAVKLFIMEFFNITEEDLK